MALLILLRHGQSMWNKLNVFTGWVDVPLSLQGIDEAIAAGKKLASTPIDYIYTSTLVRAQQTVMLAMAQHTSAMIPVVIPTDNNILSKSGIYDQAQQQLMIPVYVSHHLNERYYGELQGLNKQGVADQYGEEQLRIWRRSYKTPPPNGESLAMTCARTIPYFEEHILPQLRQGKNCLVSAHGNSLRSIVMDIEKLNEQQIVGLEIATGIPILYRYEDGVFAK